MTRELWMIVSFGAYILLFLGAVVGLGIWKAKAGAAMRVVRPEWLSEDLPKARSGLTEQQIDLMVRQLDLLCRDVED